MTDIQKPERIAKVMARAGLCSRREAERWIAEGRVKVDGEKLTTPAVTVTEDSNIVVDGKPLATKEQTRLWIFHKPKGMLVTHADPRGRKTIFDILPSELPRVVTIGRLDYNSEGLLLLTNDGGLARHLELPSTGWIRRYRVRAFGKVDEKKLEQLKKGVTIDKVRYAAASIEVEKTQGGNSWLNVGITEGKNREVRKMLAHAGLEVNRLIRTSYGPFQLGNLPVGEVRAVTSKVMKEQIDYMR